MVSSKHFSHRHKNQHNPYKGKGITLEYCKYESSKGRERKLVLTQRISDLFELLYLSILAKRKRQK